MPSIDLRVQTESGPVQGFANTYPLRSTSAAALPPTGGNFPINKWLGIPYARARRWERPQQPEPWSETKECFEFGSVFPQPASMTETMLSKLPGFLTRQHIPVSEDSHSVNVFAPGDLQEGEKLPVMVWIYGGSLNNNTSEKFFYDPTEWIRDGTERGQRCIVVSGNYRTNIFGFLASSDLSEQDSDGLSGNYGLYDCVAMLEWVQKNIASFGGDASNVTVFGQSAGAFIVSNLLVTGKKLFKKAICQSGAATTMTIRPVDEAYPALPIVLSSLSVPSTATSSDRLTALRSASAEKLLALHTANHSFAGLSLALEPKEKGIWTEDTLSRLKRGEWDEWIEGVVLGTTADEGSVFAWGLKLTSPEAFHHYLSNFPPSLRPSILSKYFPEGSVHPPPSDLITSPGSRLLGDQIFVNPVFEQAKALSAVGKKGKETKTWVYHLTTGVESLLKFSPIKLGIMHAMDIPLVFNSSSLWANDKTSSDAKTAAAIGERWFRFAIEGNPDPSWTPFTSSTPSQLVFSDAGAVENASLAQFEREKLDLHFGKDDEKAGDEEVLGHTNE